MHTIIVIVEGLAWGFIGGVGFEGAVSGSTTCREGLGMKFGSSVVAD